MTCWNVIGPNQRVAATQCREDRAELYPRGNRAARRGAAPDAMRTMFTNWRSSERWVALPRRVAKRNIVN